MDKIFSNKSMDLSICIVTWNKKDLTINCIESIYQQTTSITFEIIVVDNGSKDNTVDIIRKRFPVISLITNEWNKGFTYANNQALKHAKGRYAILLNNDTLLKENALTKMVRYMDLHSDIGALGCRLRFPDGIIQHSAYRNVRWFDALNSLLGLQRLFIKSQLFGRPRMNHLDYETAICDVDWLGGAALMVRKETYEQAGLLDENIFAFSEDWEWCMRIKHSGWRVVYFSQTEIIHYEGASSHAHIDDRGISEWAILTAATSGFYTFRKLNQNKVLRIKLYDVSRRTYFLSRALIYFVKHMIKSKPFYLGRSKGYFKAAITSYNILKKKYLAGS